MRPPDLETPLELAPRAVALAAALKTAPPQPKDGVAERSQRRTIARHSIVAEVPGHHTAQVRPHLIDGVMQPLPKLGSDLLQLPPHALLLGLPQHDELPLPRLVAAMRKAKEIEGLGLPLAAPASILDRKAAELEQVRLVGVQLQTELRQSRSKLSQEALGIRPVLKAADDVVGEPHEDHIPGRLSPSPVLGPQVEGVVEVDVSPKFQGVFQAQVLVKSAVAGILGVPIRSCVVM